MKHAPCPYCGTSAPHYLQTRDYNRRVKDEVYQYYRCPADGLVFLHPLPQDLGGYYPSEYYTLPPDPAALRAEYQAYEGYKLDLIQQYSQGKRLLEVGPGNGGFVYLAQKAGYEATVIEMDGRVCDYLSGWGVPAIHTDDVAAGVANLGQFDVIALWHVIEHMPQVWKHLGALAQHLAPGGIIIMAAPNPRALQFRLFGSRWFHLDAPRHVQLLPPSFLRNLAHNYGLQTRLVTYQDEGSAYLTLKGWEISLKKIFPRGRTYRLLQVLKTFIFPLEQRSGYGGCYVIIWEKTKA
jgi:SAM-dependent methyltransferase